MTGCNRFGAYKISYLLYFPLSGGLPCGGRCVCTRVHGRGMAWGWVPLPSSLPRRGMASLPHTGRASQPCTVLASLPREGRPGIKTNRMF